MKPLTTKQYVLLRYMYDYEREHGYPAFYKELAYYFDTSYEAVIKRVQVLGRLGYVRYCPRKPARVLYMPGMGEIARAG